MTKLFAREFKGRRGSSVPDWVADAAFYQIFPDRFARSAAVEKPGKLQPWNDPPTFRAFKGGDLVGAAQRLDDVRALGFNAIYLTPIFKSAANHRYHTYDYFEVCPILGGNDAFMFFLDKAKSLGMRVVIDGVFNHASRGFFPFNHVMENGRDSPYVDWFHFNRKWLAKDRVIRAFPDRADEDGPRKKFSALDTYGYEAWWNLPALPKFNTRCPEVREYIFSVAEYWIRKGIDGWRLDVPNEIDDDGFWREFRRRVKAVNPEAYIVGEIWGDGTRWLKGDQFDGVMNYLLGKSVLEHVLPKKPRAAIVRRSHYRELARAPGGETHARMAKALSLYPPEITLAQMNIMTSHDTPRLASVLSLDEQAIAQAIGLLVTLPGAPCIYYGDEIAMEGAHDPDCRRAFPETLPRAGLPKRVRTLVARLLHLRAEHVALRRGGMKFLRCDDEVLMFLRTAGSDAIVVALNRSRRGASFEVAIPGVRRGRLRSHLAGEGSPVPIERGRSTMTLAPGAFELYTVESEDSHD
jgi:neopullulanase